MVMNNLKSKYQGLIVGGAIGDALGMPAEGLSYEDIKRLYGSIQYYLKPPKTSKLHYLKPGQYTDDTQLMLATIKSITDNKLIRIENIVKELLKANESIRGAGRTTWTALNKLSRVGPKNSGIKGALGAGAMTRVAPLAILSSKRSDFCYDILVEDAVKITHDSEIAKKSALLYGRILTDLLEGYQRDLRSRGGIRNFVENYSKIHPKNSEETIKLKQQLGSLTELVELDEEEFVEANDTTGKIQNVLPAALYCFLKSPKNFEESVLRAVNLGGDTDTIGFIAGQLSGAYNGVGTIPKYLISELENHPEIRESGNRLYQLIHP